MKYENNTKNMSHEVIILAGSYDQIISMCIKYSLIKWGLIKSNAFFRSAITSSA